MSGQSRRLRGVLVDGLLLARAERAGTVRVEGDRDAVVRVVRRYARP